ncbi:SDR family oxidoreductase [Lactonifactor longoviformis]|uniref:SDR family oxidoreductase n=1 Tax=Lactonifactor longoviformis TaxID=341220 RepID=UPI0036F3C1B8
MKVLVCAAYGNQGRQLVPKLVKAGVDVRALDFSPAAEEKLYEMGAKEVIIGDLRKDSIMEKAITGVDTIYLVLPSGLSRVVGMAEALIEMAEEKGVKHFVFSSCMNVVPELVQHWEKYLIESVLMGSLLNYTILKPCGYMEVHYPPTNGVFSTGVFVPVMPNSKISSFISVDDITSAACKVITEGEPHYFASYDLCAPGHYDTEGAIELLGKCLKENGLELKITPPDPQPLPAEMPVHTKDMLGRIMTYHGNHPYRGNPFIFTSLMGHPAKTLEEFFKENIIKAGVH